MNSAKQNTLQVIIEKNRACHFGSLAHGRIQDSIYLDSFLFSFFIWIKCGCVCNGSIFKNEVSKNTSPLLDYQSYLDQINANELLIIGASVYLPQ